MLTFLAYDTIHISCRRLSTCLGSNSMFQKRTGRKRPKARGKSRKWLRKDPRTPIMLPPRKRSVYPIQILVTSWKRKAILSTHIDFQPHWDKSSDTKFERSKATPLLRCEPGVCRRDKTHNYVILNNTNSHSIASPCGHQSDCTFRIARWRLTPVSGRPRSSVNPLGDQLNDAVHQCGLRV